MNTESNEPATQSENFERRHGRRLAHPSGWIGGAILIVLGIFLLLQNLTGCSLNNWWALFILLPAVGAFGRAWQGYQNAGGRLSGEAGRSLFGGIILLLITAIFLFGWSWTIFGPALLILLGASLLLTSAFPK
jgi:hypothetical protein